MNEDKIRILRDNPVKEALLKLGVPTIVGMLVSALYNVVDAYFVGRLGPAQMGAVSITFPVAQVIIGLGMMFGSGVASYLSRLLGAGDIRQADRAASTALLSGLAAGIVCIALALWFLDALLVALGATPTILPYARQYAGIFIGGALLNIFNVTLNNIVTSEGAAKRAMTAMFLGCGLNAVLDPLFIYTLGWGIRGAAAVTVMAQSVTALMYVCYITRGRSRFRFSLANFKPDKVIYKEIFKVGVPTLVFQLLTSAAIGLTNAAASGYGDSAVAALGIVTRILTLGSFVIFGFLKGFQPLAGYNYGARSYHRVIEAIELSLRWTTLFCGAAALLMVALPGPILRLFTEDTRTIEIGARALRAQGIVFWLFGFQMVYCTLFLALGRGREGGILSVSRQGIFFLPAISILPGFFGLAGILWAQPLADALTICLTAILARRLNGDLRSEYRRMVEEDIQDIA